MEKAPPMKIGVIPPVPMEPFVASHHEVVNLWSAFFLQQDRASWMDTARLAGFPENFSPWAMGLYGLVCERGLEAVFYPETGVPREVLKVLRLLGEQEIRLIPFSFPLLRNQQRLGEELDNLCKRLDVDPAVLETVMETWQQVRTVLRRFDGLQQRTGAFSSRDYSAMLARSMDPRGDLEGLRREIERGILDYRDLNRERWVRLGILGLTPYRGGFYGLLEQAKAVVIYDEWGVENNPMSASTDLSVLYHQCSLPYGLKRRLERIQREAATRRLHGVILGVEYLSDCLRDEGFFKANLGLPVHTVENRGGELLSPPEEKALLRFLDQLGRKS